MAIAGCGTPADQARQRLKRAGIAPEPASMIAAAEAGNADIIGRLLVAGVPVSARDASGRTALIAATQSNRLATVSLLIRSGADVNVADGSGSTPLSYALRLPSPELVALLLEKGASGSATIRPGEPALVHAVRLGDSRLADALLRAGAAPDIRAADGWAALPLAVSRNDEPMAVTLLGARANPNIPAPGGVPSLTTAVCATNASMVALLLRHGADPSATDARGRAPLDAAVLGGDNTLVALLYKTGAISKSAGRLLAIAVDRGDHELVSLVLDHGVDPDTRGAGGKTPMQVALERNDARLARTLLAAGAAPSPWLVQAINQRSTTLIDLLLKAKADPNRTGPGGEPALSIALRSGDLRLVEKLLAAGANPSRSGREGQTPLAVAVACREAQAAKLLLDHKADPNATLAEPPSQAFLALLASEKIRYFLQHDSGVTPLMIAAGQGDTETARILLAAGAKPDVATKRNKHYPINFAAEEGHTAIMQVLLGKEPGGREKGVYIEINLSEQTARLWQDGKIKLTSPVSTGRSGYRTPKGEYVITNKYRHWISTIYRVPMPYFMRLSCGNFGLHAGYVPGFPASHGCIRLPPEYARTFFHIAEVGHRVTIIE